MSDITTSTLTKPTMRLPAARHAGQQQQQRRRRRRGGGLSTMLLPAFLLLLALGCGSSLGTFD
jgi:hypothetical protein